MAEIITKKKKKMSLETYAYSNNFLMTLYRVNLKLACIYKINTTVSQVFSSDFVDHSPRHRIQYVIVWTDMRCVLIRLTFKNQLLNTKK